MTSETRHVENLSELLRMDLENTARLIGEDRHISPQETARLLIEYRDESPIYRALVRHVQRAPAPSIVMLRPPDFTEWPDRASMSYLARVRADARKSLDRMFERELAAMRRRERGPWPARLAGSLSLWVKWLAFGWRRPTRPIDKLVAMVKAARSRRKKGAR